ncbi:UMP kinase [Vulcanisaeta souniana]|uniref:UMP kinase n=1 Tax=Vulcanisaeta souniana JCM 11219 TaxID=1293586 RepID=A0A830E3R2_9CREN|nr:UMP kinase [Vulcanisaeta souniana]BDR92964.1 uridylate kinase [Vulcanisaeta souniana JCM 11219]GGI83876.1 uridylate kinase [Vulcanisaeta souniana JCM 11219]
MLKEPFTLKLSGHLFDNDNLLPSYVNLIHEFWKNGYKMVVVTGGGSLARRYIELGRRMNANEAMLDLLGISVSRLNAQLLAAALSDIAYITIPTNLDEVFRAWLTGKLVITGGFQPGQSTATVALLVSEFLGIKKMIDCANVDAVYTSDPRIDPNAKRLSKVSIAELKDMLKSKTVAGTYDLLDPWALGIAQRSGITIFVVGCNKPETLRRLMINGISEGTIITP